MTLWIRRSGWWLVGVGLCVSSGFNAGFNSGTALAQTAPAFAPGTMPAGMMPPSGMPGAAPSYLLASQIDWLSLLPPPPAAKSVEQQHDLQLVLDTQTANKKIEAVRERAVGDTRISCFRIAEVLGSAADEQKLPKTAAFLSKAAIEVSHIGNDAKNFWQRPRPYVISSKVETLGDMKGRGAAAAGDPVNLRDYSSYPSGHSMFGTACGYLLAQMVPEKQADIYARTEQYRQARIIVGAHYLTDIEAGRVLATAALAVMSQNYSLQRDLAEARTELRRALGLPEAIPARGATADTLH